SETPLPEWLTAIKEQDAVAYPAHSQLGKALSAAGCDSSAAALQWLKAAAHARGPGDVEQAQEGLSQAAQRSQEPAALRQTLCGYAQGRPLEPDQEAALHAAGLRCEPD